MTLIIFYSEQQIFANKNTPVTLDGFHEKVNLEEAEPWLAPNYENQENVLGYGPGVFGIPAGMEDRVSFWLDIYTKYTTDQGVLHDSRYVHLIYEEVDFRDIMSMPDVDSKKKSKLRLERVKEAKKRIEQRLQRLEAYSSPSGLEGEDLKYWYMFAGVAEKNKFKEASKKGRLRFQLGQKDRFLEGIYHSGRYIREMEKIFREHQLPVELTRLPFVESSFNLNARSRVGASGIWQFMRSTGRQYMRIDATVDERNDPIRATEAAAKKMKSNFNMLGNWPLAVTGYNHGPYGMSRLVKKHNTDNLVEIVNLREGSFGFASASFYASFLAAIEAEKRAEKYFGVVFREKELKAKKMTLEKTLSAKNLVDIFLGDEVLARKYNPHLQNSFWRGSAHLTKRHYISVPETEYESYVARYQGLAKENKKVSLSQRYRVSSGDTLSKIALDFRVDLRQLMELNGIKDPRTVRAGQELTIPD